MKRDAFQGDAQEVGDGARLRLRVSVAWVQLSQTSAPARTHRRIQTAMESSSSGWVRQKSQRMLRSGSKARRVGMAYYRRSRKLFIFNQF